MAVASRGTSSLNPNAPLFIPLAYRQVDDFSAEWWNLVQSSPWFRDYWLRERFNSGENTNLSFAVSESVVGQDEGDEFSELELQLEEAFLGRSVFDEQDTDARKNSIEFINGEEMTAVKGLSGKAFKPKFERYGEKPPQIINVKGGRRWIHQPR
eukprot:TRINITY_DN3281_c0_g1_i1.p1 TRINITY_DN3281_c0_g1~~TRINITY_DN3281_c0_g1_i1.p1  ORF type:complete len:154 (+),score=15.87 TRINITY_DN3281_c0_g1_i1:241-702(+)